MREPLVMMDLASYKMIVQSRIYPWFRLHQPDISLISDKISQLGPGNVPLEHSFDKFALVSRTTDLKKTVQILMA